MSRWVLVESEKMNIFDKSDEILIGILANQTASALEMQGLST